MGLEYIVQPQVFLGGLTALGPGIGGLTESYPLLTTYNYWTSTASVDTSAFPIPGTWSIYDDPNNSASFIVTVGGVVQPPETYSIDILNRLLTFNTLISADIEVAATQLATAAPSSQSFNYVTSVTGEFTDIDATNTDTVNLSAQVGTIDSLYVTNLTAVSSVLEVVNITNYEVDGYTVNGDLTVSQDVNITGNVTAAQAIATTLSAENINIYNSIGTGNVVPAVEVANVLANCVSALAIDIDGVVLYLPLLSAA